MPYANAKKLPDINYLKSIFEFYDNNLYWKYRPESHFATENKWELFNRKHFGKKAGTYGPRGYGKVCFDGFSYPIHKISYMIQSGKQIEINDLVDHIDRDPRNNNIENLRIVSSSQNCFNRERGKNNTTGVKGVDYVKRTNRWRARICVDGKRYTKYYDTLLDAACAAYSMRKRHHGDYAAY